MDTLVTHREFFLYLRCCCENEKCENWTDVSDTKKKIPLIDNTCFFLLYYWQKPNFRLNKTWNIRRLRTKIVSSGWRMKKKWESCLQDWLEKKLTFSVEQSQWFVGWFGSAAVVLFAFQMRIFNDTDNESSAFVTQGGRIRQFNCPKMTFIWCKNAIKLNEYLIKIKIQKKKLLNNFFSWKYQWKLILSLW